jgi:hypothetical protein
MWDRDNYKYVVEIRYRVPSMAVDLVPLATFCGA